MIIVSKKLNIVLVLVLIAVILSITLLVTLVNPNNVQSSAKITDLAQFKKIPIYCVKTNSNKVALSFDAAWGADKTRKIMDELDKYNLKATFFLVGFWVDKYPELVKEIHDRGHLVANHSENHPHLSKMDKSTITTEIVGNAKKIESIIGCYPTYFRAPYGEYNNDVIDVCQENDIQVIQWDVDSLDWKGITQSQITERILSKVKSGSIILCHNNSDYIVEALPTILLGLQNKQLLPVRMDELVLKDNYYINNIGEQIENSN